MGRDKAGAHTSFDAAAASALVEMPEYRSDALQVTRDSGLLGCRAFEGTGGESGCTGVTHMYTAQSQGSSAAGTYPEPYLQPSVVKMQGPCWFYTLSFTTRRGVLLCAQGPCEALVTCCVLAAAAAAAGWADGAAVPGVGGAGQHYCSTSRHRWGAHQACASYSRSHDDMWVVRMLQCRTTSTHLLLF
jgi:hypothetical protein